MGVKKNKENVHSVNSYQKDFSDFSNSSSVNNQNCKCLYTNADQYLNKRNEMKALVEIHQPDIIGITEVKPKQARFDIQDSEIAIEGYELFHNLEEKGRGIALLVKKELKPTPNATLKATFSENLFADCTQLDGTSLVVGLIYRSPGSTLENNAQLCELIRNTAEVKKENLLLVGDFNLPSIDWENEVCPIMKATLRHSFYKPTLKQIYSSTRRK